MPSEYEIEIVDFNAIEGGIEVFARAWKDGVQLGFGKDGTIDIERFRIFNPPVLVEDPLGDIIRTWNDDITGETMTRTLREDPEEALRQSLVHTIKQVGKDGSNIVPNLRGNTTSTFYADAADGMISNSGGSTWSTYRDATTGTVTGEATRYLMADKDGSTYTLSRHFYPFDTSAIPDGDTIDSATFSLDNTGASSGDRYVCLIQTTQADPPTALASGDYDSLTVNSPTEGSSRVLYSTSGYKDHAMNASGIGWISKTGYTKLGVRMAKDVDNTDPGARNYVLCYQSEQTGTTNDPKLVVVHSAGSSFTPTPMMHMMQASCY